jgi:hypothetical protein
MRCGRHPLIGCLLLGAGWPVSLGLVPDVAKAAHEVVEEAKDAGAWVFGGGLRGHERAS